VSVKVAAAASAGLLAVLLMFLTVVGGGSGSPASAMPIAVGSVCATTGPMEGMNAAQAANARIVAAEASELAGDRGALIALMTGLAESGLRVLGNPSVVTGDVPVQGSGSDHDSLGIFQQRANWGPAVARLDPVASTDLFLGNAGARRGLLTLSGWQAESPWAAAQDVQVSAYDGHPRAANNYSSEYGGNYHAQLTAATAALNTIKADSAKLHCGSVSGPPADGKNHGLPDGYIIPADATPPERRVVGFAIAQLDKPYLFGAAGPAAFDCSGLMLAAWAQVGVALPHYTVDQAQSGTSVASPGAMSPSDLILIPGDGGTLAAPDHVGMYIGHGLVLHASSPAVGIRVQTFQNFVGGQGVSTMRHIG
jgi:cell wall-associated NlpC family hydrolase